MLTLRSLFKNILPHFTFFFLQPTYSGRPVSVYNLACVRLFVFMSLLQDFLHLCDSFLGGYILIVCVLACMKETERDV